MTTAGRGRRTRTVFDALGGVLLLVPTVVVAPLLRRAFNRWGTTKGPRGGLLTRQRLTFPGGTSILWHLLEPIDFVMERRMLLGIKRRAERGHDEAARP